jgi:putative hydrolase of the HAD superfamily
MKPVQISDILFDLGNVLIPLMWERTWALLDKVLPERLQKLLRESPDEFKLLFDGPTTELETGRIDFTEFCRRMNAELGMRIDAQEFERIWVSMFTADPLMAELGRNLARRYGVWLVSNTGRVHYEHILSAFPEVCFFKDAALSYEIGFMKPEAEYYAAALKKFGIEAESAVFIDDLAANVRGAERAGMTGLLFTGRENLIADLEKLGVTIDE